MNRSTVLSAFAELERRNQWGVIYNKLGIEASKQASELELSAEESTKEENFPKNRYINVLPYDQNRVLLKNLEEGQTDFLNASPLSVPFANRDYILTQGPLEITAEDFWQMVWENKSKIVVMLSNIIENQGMKCYHYFVDEDEKKKTFGKFSIELQEEYGTKIYRIRKIKLTALNEKFLENAEQNSRIISHFHFITWPDFGVPSETSSFLEFLEKTNEAQKLLNEDESKVIVHCSAGIGRSGAFIVVDSFLNYFQNGSQTISNASGDMAKPPKSIEEFVLYARRHRMGLIQTKEQLRFCWQAIVDWLKNHPDGKSDEPGIPSRKRYSQSDSSIEMRKQKIQEMREKLRRVEESKNRWWYRLLNDDNTKYWVGSSVAVLGAVMAFYVYNGIHASK
jgi:protein tyrosine phosphatase